MRRIIKIIFGKPYDNKILKFYYWFGVIGYMLGIPIIIFVAFLVHEIFIKVALLISIIIWPILFRLTYNINAYLYNLTYGNKKKAD